MEDILNIVVEILSVDICDAHQYDFMKFISNMMYSDLSILFSINYTLWCYLNITIAAVIISCKIS